MTLIILACCIVAVGALLGFKIEKMNAAVDRLEDRIYWTGEQCRNLELSQRSTKDAVDHVAKHFTVQGMGEPMPLDVPETLPKRGDDTAVIRKRKKK